MLTPRPDDDDSIADLSKTTSHCFDTDKVRLLYIRAQVSRIGESIKPCLPQNYILTFAVLDLKIELALAETMRRYKKSEY